MSPNSSVEVPETAILEGDLTQPKPYGATEQFVVEVNLTQADENGVTNIYFTVNAYDETGFQSDTSNIGQATFRALLPRYVPLPVTQTTTTPPLPTSSMSSTQTNTPSTVVTFVTPDVTVQPVSMSGLPMKLSLFLASGLGLFFSVWTLVCFLANSRFVQGSRPLPTESPEPPDPPEPPEPPEPPVPGGPFSPPNIFEGIPLSPLTGIKYYPRRNSKDGYVKHMVISPEIHDRSTIEESQGSSSGQTSDSSWNSDITPPFVLPDSEPLGRIPHARAKYNPEIDENNTLGQYF